MATDLNDIAARKVLDSIMAEIPTDIIETDDYTIRKYEDGRVDTILKKTMIKKMESSYKST